MAITLTETAVRQVKTMLQKHELATSYGLRVGVKAGGCAGREYVLELEEGPEAKDRVYDFDGLKVFVDPKSYLFINGLELDYQETKMGGSFVYKNPNAKGGCGCGTSFNA